MLNRFRRLRLYGTPEALECARDGSLAKVLLVGGFGGRWNFGDMVQLKSAIEWHLERTDSGSVLPAIALQNVQSDEVLQRITAFCGLRNLLIFGCGRPRPELGLMEIRVVQNVDVLHFYGGGILNSFWAQARLPLLEHLLERYHPARYAISGQQIEDRLASTVARHLKRFHPVLIGCRDEASVAILRKAGTAAEYSGDDSWEELIRIKSAASPLAANGSSQQLSFALHCGLAPHVYRSPGLQTEIGKADVMSTVNSAFQVLRRVYGEGVSPLLVNAYTNPNDDLNTASSLQSTAFPMLFPRADWIDLPALVLSGHIGETLRKLFAEHRYDRYIGTYYHPTLLFKVLGVPSFLFAFNEYYSQKAAGLGQHVSSFTDFMATSAPELADQQEAFVRTCAQVRSEWLRSLHHHLS